MKRRPVKRRPVDAHCRTCGMACDSPAEFHPYVFCVLKKAGRDPWKDFVDTCRLAGLDVSAWPARPPLARDVKRLIGGAA